MRTTDRRTPLLLGFLTLSLFLHLLLLSLLPERPFRASRPEPVVVEVRPPQPRLRERETELPPQPDQRRETPAKRLGPSDRIAEKEMAPEGAAPDERPAPPPPRPAPPKTPRRPEPAPVPAPALPHTSPEREAPLRDETAEAPPSVPPAPAPWPDLKTLTTLPQVTLERIESERRKYRAEVEKGDAYFLDMEKDILISFFQRFSTNVYNVWNYPARARERGEEGTCLLRITINRDGSVADVTLMESSGFSALDEEAIAAVRKGASYGHLPRAYQEETLTIYAFFNYNLIRRPLIF